MTLKFLAYMLNYSSKFVYDYLMMLYINITFNILLIAFVHGNWHVYILKHLSVWLVVLHNSMNILCNDEYYCHRLIVVHDFNSG